LAALALELRQQALGVGGIEDLADDSLAAFIHHRREISDGRRPREALLQRLLASLVTCY